MTTQSARGAKRTCQNEACGARFYDLMRNPITCPICQTVFAPPPVEDTKLKSVWGTSRNAPRHTIVAPTMVEEAGDDEASAPESDATDGNDDGDTTSENPDLLLELDEDGEAGDSGVVVGDTKD